MFQLRAAARSKGAHPACLFCIFSVTLISALSLVTTGCNQSLQAGATSAGRAANASPGTGLRMVPIDPPNSPTQVRLEVTPTVATLSSGGTLQFAAIVRQSANPDVRWSANWGTVSPTGLFLAPRVSSPQVVRVMAASVVDPWVRAEAFITISPSPTQGSALAIAAASLPPATSSVPYSVSLTATGGTLPYSWNITTGSLPSGLQLNPATGEISGVTAQSGAFAFTAQVTDSVAAVSSASLALSVDSSNSSGSNFDGPAELPRVYLQTALTDTPAPGNTLHVAAGGDLQAALNAANCGDTIELQADATFSGLFRLPGKKCDDQHWIIVRTDAPDSSLPPEGTRLTPCYAGVPSLPGRPAFACPTSVRVIPRIIYSGKAGSGPIVLSAGANHYRLLGLELTRATGSGFVGALVIADTIPATASNIVVDRVWLHGSLQDDTARGVYLNRITNAAMVDSYFSDFHCTAVTGACTDSQSIAGGSGDYPAGPYKIVNNFLEAAGECVMFGGGKSTTTPADIEIRRNHFFRPMIWMSGAPGFVGGASGHPFVVKNNFELKNATRVLLEGNILENSWGGFTQAGYSIMLTPKGKTATKERTDTVNLCPVCQVTDVTIRYSTVSHAGGGIDIATALSGDGYGVPALAGERISIHDVTVEDIDAKHYNGYGGLIAMLNGWDQNVLNTVTINHITGFPDPTSHFLSLRDAEGKPQMSGFVFTNNIVGAGEAPIIGAGGGTTNCDARPVQILQSLSACFSSYVFSSNVVVGVPAKFMASPWPANNFFPSRFNDTQFVNFSGGDYHLSPSSPYKNAGSDGKDLGADIDAIQAAIAGVY